MHVYTGLRSPVDNGTGKYYIIKQYQWAFYFVKGDEAYLFSSSVIFVEHFFLVMLLSLNTHNVFMTIRVITMAYVELISIFYCRDKQFFLMSGPGNRLTFYL